MRQAIVFVHGINSQAPEAEINGIWRRALSSGGVDMRPVKSTFCHYAGFFFPESRVAPMEAMVDFAEDDLSDDRKKLVNDLTDRAIDEMAPECRQEYLRAMKGEMFPRATENISEESFDPTTLLPKKMVEAVIRKYVFQLYKYFDNDPVSGTDENARDLIRRLFREAVATARKHVGDTGKVHVLSHSMGSVVAWDCIAHDEECGFVDSLVTFGSPLGLDFVHRELAVVNGANFARTYPSRRLRGAWINLAARFDVICAFDARLETTYSGGGEHSVRTVSLTNPDFRAFSSPRQRVIGAHSGTGYLRSPAMSRAMEELGLALERPEQEKSAATAELGVTQLATKRYAALAASRRRMQARLAAQASVLGVELDERIISRLALRGMDEVTAARMVSEAHTSAAGRVMLERVLGEPDFIQSSYALRMAVLTRAVGQVRIGELDYQRTQGFGTGFMISPTLLMTNNHVLPDESTARGSRIWFDFAKDINDSDLDGEGFDFDPDRFFVTSPETELDYTIVAVDVPEGGLQRPWAKLIQRSGKVLMDQSVNIIQHPRGRRQELITRNSKLTFIDDKPDYAHYSGDTEPGSSGSPCFNDRWELAFLHHASVPETDAQGRWLKSDGQVWRQGDDPARIKWIANEGIRISRIVDDVFQKGLYSSARAELFEECFTDPELSRFVKDTAANIDDAPPTERTLGGQLVRRHRDGRVSYLFEVSFGPYAPEHDTQSRIGPSETIGPAVTSARRPFDMAQHKPPITSLLERSIKDLVAESKSRETWYDRDNDAEDISRYYDSIRFSTGSVRMFHEYRALVERTHSKVFGYNSARLKVLYPYADLHEDDTLRSVYSGEILRPAEVILEEAMILADRVPLARENFGTLGLDGLLALADAKDGVGEASLEATDVPWNCEHVVPQSWYGKRSPMVSDLHHLFTCERGCNSYRGNNPYGDFPNFDGSAVDPIEAELRKKCGLVNDLEGIFSFEPEKNKGVVARATLYFLLRYPNEVGNSPGEFPEARIEMLKKWHETQEVTDWERHRNRAIFLTQGNRNPFIDLPELVSKLDFGKSFEN